MLYGTRISMTVGLVAVSITLAIGLFAGAIAGFFGGIVDIVISRVIEIVLLFPALFLILTLVGLLAPDPQHSEQGGQRIYIAMVVIGKQPRVDISFAQRRLDGSQLHGQTFIVNNGNDLSESAAAIRGRKRPFARA